MVTGVRFQSGTPGSRQMVFSYSDYVERIIVEVTAGVPAQFKLVSGPELVRKSLHSPGLLMKIIPPLTSLLLHLLCFKLLYF